MYTHTHTHQRTLSSDSINHGHHHVHPRSTSLDDNLKISFAATTYKPQLVEHVREIMLQTTLCNTMWSFQYES